MADRSKIEWTDATWNIVNGCSVLSPGCTNCYAMRLAGWLKKNDPSRAGLTEPSKTGPVWTGEVRWNAKQEELPLRWRRPRRVFVAAHGDIFHENVPTEWLDRIWAIMKLAENHSFQVLTKRPKRMRLYLSDPELPERIAQRCLIEGRNMRPGAPCWQGDRWRDAGQGVVVPARWPLPNVHLGVSAEDQVRANERVPELLQTPAAFRFVSLEPLLGPVDLARVEFMPGNSAYMIDARYVCEGYQALNWVIAGGESGLRARPMEIGWVRALRDQCAATGTPFFFKQWGEWAPFPDDDFRYGEHGYGSRADKVDVKRRMYRLGKRAAGRMLDGREHNELPPMIAPEPERTIFVGSWRGSVSGRAPAMVEGEGAANAAPH